MALEAESSNLFTHPKIKIRKQKSESRNQKVISPFDKGITKCVPLFFVRKMGGGIGEANDGGDS